MRKLNGKEDNTGWV